MADLQDRSTLLVHCHMPKTAGSALNRSALLPRYDPFEFRLIYGVDFERTPLLTAETMSSDVRFLSGHIPFGCAAQAGRPVLYVSVLRDPVERMFSFLNFVAVAKRHGARKGFDRDMQALARTDPVQFVRLILTRRRVMHRQSNIMTRLAAGLARLGDIRPDNDALDRALSNARSGNYILGMQDDFDVFASDLGDVLNERGLGNSGMNEDLVTSRKLEKRFDRVIRQEDMPESIIRTIRKANDLDLRLCDFVRNGGALVDRAA